MFKKMIMSIVVLITTISNINSQSNWIHVGPISTNQLYNNGFETAQMTKVITSSSAPSVVFATSIYGGLWVSYTGGTGWDNVSMMPTGLSSAKAIAFKNANEVIVGNYQAGGDYSDQATDLSYSNRVSAYNFWNQTWTHYPLFPVNTPSFVINVLATDPLNENIIFAGTSIGLYKCDVSLANPVWSPIVSNCNIASIIFTDNYTCFISGGNLAAVYPNYGSIPGMKYMIMVSTNSGNSFVNCTPSPALNIPSNVDSYTELCAGSNGVYVLTRAGDLRYLHHIDASTYSSASYGSYNNGGLDGGRMAIAYDSQNNDIWFGGQRLLRYSIAETLYYGNSLQGVTYNCFHNGQNGGSGGGKVHDDIHCLHVENNNLWVACDGGIAKAAFPAPPATPYAISFSSMNNGINVNMLFSFSGSEQDSKLYALGGQDIVNTDIYDEATHKNRYTQATWENDGAFIYKFDDNLMIFDRSNSPTTAPDETMVSLDKGYSIANSFNPYLPLSNVFSPDSVLHFGGGSQRTLQDPFRAGRIYQIGRMGINGPAILQYHFPSNKMLYKNGLGDYGPRVQDMSFNPSSKNVVYAIATPYLDVNSPAYIPSKIYKYIGPDFDDCWWGHNHYTYPPNNLPQWQTLNPDYLNFHSVISGAVDFTSANLWKIFYKKIETSPWNPNLIYIAGNYGHPGDPATKQNFELVKVIKYDGSNWINYSTGLPSQAVVYSMIMDHYSNDALYLSTSAGTYYRDASMVTGWILYSNGMHTIPSVQMEVNYKENTVRSGTFGYGIWKSPLQCPSVPTMNLTYITAPGVYEANNINSYADNDLMHGPIALRGTNSVMLLPGFKATPSGLPNNYLFAFIHGCNGGSSSPYMYRASEMVTEKGESIFNPPSKEFNVFPNPAKGLYEIENDLDEEFEVQVMNLQGQLIKSVKFDEKEGKVNISEFSSGLYLFICKSVSGYTKTIKVIKD